MATPHNLNGKYVNIETWAECNYFKVKVPIEFLVIP